MNTDTLERAIWYIASAAHVAILSEAPDRAKLSSRKPLNSRSMLMLPLAS
jgi:hypothetical protein